MRLREPLPSEFSTEEEYLAALDAYETALYWAAEYERE